MVDVERAEQNVLSEQKIRIVFIFERYDDQLLNLLLHVASFCGTAHTVDDDLPNFVNP